VFSDRTAWASSANRFTTALEHARASGRTLLDLAVSNPTACGFEYDADAIRRAFEHPEVLRYRPEPLGLRAARTAIAALYSDRVDAAHIFITAGTSEAYAHIFRLLCKAGDEVLIAAPGYPLLDLIADLCDVRLMKYHLFYDHAWHIDLHDLEAKITPRTRAIVLVHPNNPTGSYVAEREALNELCGRRNLALLVDEVFLEFPLEEDAARSFAGNSPALTFTMNGLSKMAGLPQMKAAWIVLSGPERVAEEASPRLEVISDTYLSPNAPVQWALPEMLATRVGIQQQLAARVRENRAILDEELGRQKMCQRLEVEGGWYAIVRVPVTRSDERLAIELLEQEGVLVQPGHFYDFASDGYLVVSLITPARIFEQGSRKVLGFFAK